MAGILDSSKTELTEGDDLNDPVLDRIVEQMEEKLPPEVKVDYEKIVTAGMKILFSDKTHHLLEIATQKMKLGEEGGVAAGSAKIAGTIISILHRESKGAISMPASPPAAITLCCQILEFCKLSGLTVENAEISEAIRLTIQRVFKFYNIGEKEIRRSVALNEVNPKTGFADDETPAPLPVEQEGFAPKPEPLSDTDPGVLEGAEGTAPGLPTAPPAGAPPTDVPPPPVGGL